MKLRFIAARDALVPERRTDGSAIGSLPIGQAYRYIGRVYDPEKRGYPASKDAFECDSDTGLAAYLIKETREASLNPADVATAKACGVPYVQHEFSDGVWVPSAVTEKRVSAGKADK